MKDLLCLCLFLAGLCAVTHCHREDICHQVNNTNLHNGAEHLLKHHCGKQGSSYGDFAFRFYKHAIAKEADKNIFFSPISISTAFALLALGAKSTTLSQILEGLGFDSVPEARVEDVHESFHKVLAALNCTDANITLNIGNALFTAIGYEPQEAFLKNTKQFYDADFFSINFHKENEAKTQINNYVKEKTKEKIPKLIDHLGRNTIMVIVNYIYFKAAWEKDFDPEFTYEGDFFVTTNASVNVSMMQREDDYNTYYDRDLSCTVVELPYQGTARALLILPDDGKMKQVEDTLSKETICKWDNKLETRLSDLTEMDMAHQEVPQAYLSAFGYHASPFMLPIRVHLHLPKTSISGSYDVEKLFKEMGITDVFSSKADLSGITGSRDLHVSQAVHKALLEIDEAGTEAAGATAIIVAKVLLPSLTIEFNRPFLILISDKPTSTTLFLGKVVNPTKK